MYCQKIWLNGSFCELASAAIPITNHSLHYASAVFEGIMSYNGRVFRIEEHLNRLFASAKIMYLEVNFSLEDIKESIIKLLDLNNCNDGSYYIRPLIWPNSQSFLKRDVKIPANVVIFIQKHTPLGIEKGVKMLISSWVKGPLNSVPHQCKGSGNYMNSILSKQEAVSLGFDDALLLDYEGNVAEAASSNVFFLTHDGILVTPKIKYCLAGVTRKVVLEIAVRLGILCVEKDIASEEVKSFKQAFLTGTAIEIQPIEVVHFAKTDELINFENSDLAKVLYIEYKKLCLS